MPRHLVARIVQANSIQEFWDAAQKRYVEGLVLAMNSERTGAIYLWGYAAEMTLKSAYFRLIGYRPTQSIRVFLDVANAIQRGRDQFSIVWPNKSKGHNVRAWSELLIAERQFVGTPYPSRFAIQVQTIGMELERLWTEGLRYHRNIAYTYEVIKVEQNVSFLMSQYQSL